MVLKSDREERLLSVSKRFDAGACYCCSSTSLLTGLKLVVTAKCVCRPVAL